MKRSIIVEAIAILYIILFLYTGISKWLDYYIFIETVGTTPLFRPIAGQIAIILPATEILISIFLFIRRTRQAALYASLVLMILFTGYIIYILNINEKIPCSCGGILQEMSWKQHLIFNGLFILLAITGIWLSKKELPRGPEHKSILVGY
jgi:uncharacterized membrane protein YphA (DoxX/SURF4 family)